MITATTRLGTWADVDTGVLAYIQGRAVHLEYATGGHESWALPESGALYLRVAVLGDRAAVICQGGETGHAYLSTRPGLWTNLGPSVGQNAVEVVGHPGLDVVTVYIQRTPTVYTRAIYDRQGLRTTTTEWMAETSQGFLDASHPALLFTDAGRRWDPDLLLPNVAGPLIVGQHPQDPPRLMARYQDQLVLLAHGLAYEPRVAEWTPGTFLAVARSGPTFLHVVCTPPFAATEPSPPVPPVPPVDVPMPPAEFPNYEAQVAALAAQYPAEFADCHRKELGDRAWDFIRRVAWELHQLDPRVGLNGKRGGAELSMDALAIKVPNGASMGKIVDVVGGAGAAGARPAWQIVDELSNGRWVQPEAPGGSAPVPGPTPPRPPVSPAPVTCTCPPVNLTPVTQTLQVLVATLADVNQRLIHLAQRQEELTELTAQRLQTATSGWPVKVEGRVFGQKLTLTGRVGE